MSSAESPLGIVGGAILSANLPPPATVGLGTIAFTTDQGMMIAQAGGWVVYTGGGSLELVQGATDLTAVTKVTLTGAVLTGPANNATLAIPGTTQVVNTAIGAATVSPDVSDVILDGVSPTFALTFPAPVDGQVLRVMAATLIQNFSTIVTAPGTVIKSPPVALLAGTAVTWKYNAAATTWYVAEAPASLNLTSYTSNGTWTNPAPTGGRSARVILIGAGGGGGSGCSQASGTASSGGGGGGGAGLIDATFDCGILPATVAVTVPAGGAGGTSVTSALGNPGSAGLDTTFGTYLTAFGGGGGAGGALSGNSGGGGGAGINGRGGSTTTGAAGASGGTGGGAGGAGANGGSGTTMTTGSGGGGCASGAAGSTGGAAMLGGSGGGGGGGLTTIAATNGGTSGNNLPSQNSSVAGGAGTGGNGRTPVGMYAGTGAAGGASSFTAGGFNGGLGGTGSGGGGGGSSVTGQPSGIGGQGGNGAAYVIVQ